MCQTEVVQYQVKFITIIYYNFYLYMYIQIVWVDIKQISILLEVYKTYNMSHIIWRIISD